MFEPFYKCLHAEVLALAVAWEEALDEVMAALAYAEQSGNRYWNAQLLKLQGDFQQVLCLPPAIVEHSYQHAIAVARDQGGRMLELPRSNRPGRPLAAPGEAGRGVPALAAGLRLVHRRLRNS